MNVWVFLQARTGSARLPGKVLAPFGDGLLIDAVVQRAEQLGPPVCVVVPTIDADKELYWLCSNRKWTFRSGSEEDVLARFVDAARDLDADHIVRVTADCPFLDVEAGRWTIQEHLDSGADFTHYVAEGRGVEVFTRDALERSLKDAPRSVTIFHEHPDEWILHNPRRYTINELKFSVDTADELDLARRRLKWHVQRGILRLARYPRTRVARTAASTPLGARAFLTRQLWGRRGIRGRSFRGRARTRLRFRVRLRR